MTRSAILLVVFTAVAIALALPDLRHVTTVIPGDSGDGILNLWILRAVQAGVPHGWRGLWNAPIFWPSRRTLAYSDAMLPVALVHWPLRLAFGDAFALNLIYLTSWVLCSWWTYQLCARVARTWGAPIVAALAFTYASIRVSQHQHFQLVIGGALLPLVLLALMRCLRAPSVTRGLLLGLSFAATALCAMYFGVMTGVMVVVIVAGWLAVEYPLDRGRVVPLAVALGVSALVVVALVQPVAAQYVRLQRQPEFRRGFEPAFAANVDAFLSAGPDNDLLRVAPVIGERSRAARSVENRLFPGLVATTFGVIGLLSLAVRLRRQEIERARVVEILLIAVAGLVMLVLAFGDRMMLGHREITLPFAILRENVPGFSAIRATARFALGGQLALAVLAAVGLDAVLVGRSKLTQAILTIALAGLVFAESAMGLESVRVPTANDDGGVMEALAARPGGAVVELPIESSARGMAWSFVEPARLLLAIGDGHPRVNGYSGFEPVGFPELAARLNRFPGADALAEARSLGVRFVVLRTALVGTPGPPELAAQLNVDGVGRYADDTARRLLADLPADQIKRVDRLAGAYLVELR